MTVFYGAVAFDPDLDYYDYTYERGHGITITAGGSNSHLIETDTYGRYKGDIFEELAARDELPYAWSASVEMGVDDTLAGYTLAGYTKLTFGGHTITHVFNLYKLKTYVGDGDIINVKSIGELYNRVKFNRLRVQNVVKLGIKG